MQGLTSSINYSASDIFVFVLFLDSLTAMLVFKIKGQAKSKYEEHLISHRMVSLRPK